HACPCARLDYTSCVCYFIRCSLTFSFFFFFNDPATTDIYTLSLHDALPIFRAGSDRADAASVRRAARGGGAGRHCRGADRPLVEDRKSTRLNSSHRTISYAVFCLKKKKKKNKDINIKKRKKNSDKWTRE